jgi:hypothetical protein
MALFFWHKNPLHESARDFNFLLPCDKNSPYKKKDSVGYTVIKCKYCLKVILVFLIHL